MVFADAARPTHEVRPAGCWAPKDTRIAREGTSGRQRLNLHGAVDLETGSTRMIEATTVDAASTIALLMAIVSMYPTKRLILDPQPLLRDLERLWTIRSEIPARGGAEKLGHSKKIYDRAVSPIKTDFCQAATSAKYFTLRGSFI